MAGPRVLLSCQRAPQIPLAANMRHRSEMAELQRVCHAMVRAAQQAGKRAPGTPSSLLDTLVSATDDGGVDGDPAQAASGTTGSKLSDRELIDQTLTFLVAGEMLPAARAAGIVSLSLSLARSLSLSLSDFWLPGVTLFRTPCETQATKQTRRP